jgi:2-polyprenyl-6-methoxyphenol hydroxylase-like FAD-dependent oxidoreductase
MARSTETVHIAGAGIGGLAAAVALRRHGVPVVVYERSETLEPIGAGLSLWPNAVLALESLGVEGLRGGTIPRGGGGVWRWDGRPLAVDEADAIERRYGAPLSLVHRAELQEALLDALGPDSVRLGECVASLDQAEDAVTVRFADGSADTGALLIGADGLRSTVRAALLGPAEPRTSGLVAFRGVVPLASPERGGEFWGPGGIFGVAPLSGGRTYWYATLAEGDDRSLSDVFGGWADPIPEVLRLARDREVLRHPLHDRPPAHRWTAGRVGLLGDAAHPMLPFLGQGACQAIEDAVALGEAVGAHGPTPQALRAYEDARRRRATMLVRRSRVAGRVAHARARRLRDAFMSGTPERARHRQLDAALGLR